MKVVLYKEIKETIKNYNQECEIYDIDDCFDAIEKKALEIYPDKKVIVLSYETDNDTYELDRQLDEILDIGKQEKIIDYCNCWDDKTIITTIIAEK